MKKYTYWSVAIFALIGINQIQSQDLGTKTIDVVKAYTPTIANVNKPREQASVEDSVTLKKKKINYTIYSIPVASTFIPEKGKAMKIIHQSTKTYSNSYAYLGGGNYGTLLGSAYIHLPLDRESSVFISGEHYSSQGGIKDIISDNNFSDSNLQIGYDYKEREFQWGATADIFHRLYNWYGIKTNVYENTFIEKHIKTPSHTYLGGSIDGYIETNSFFRKMNLSVRLMKDDYKSSEFEIHTTPNLIFDIGQEYSIFVKTDIKYLNGKFNKNFKGNKSIDYQWIELSTNPYFILNQGDFNVKLGGTISFILGKDKNYTRFYPNINASLRLIDDYAIIYGGVEGNTQLNSYKNLTDINPYLSPTLEIHPTFNDYTAFLGLKGNLDSNLLYNLQFGYGEVTKMALFIPNIIPLHSTLIENYQYYNSFNTYYNNGHFLKLKAEIEGDIAKIFFFELGGSYQSYTIEKIGKNVPNIPNFTFDINTDFKVLKKWMIGAGVSYVGDRKSYDYYHNSTHIPTKLKILKGYIDLALHMDYNIDKKWSIFLKGNNLLNNSYENWLYYPVQGLQVSAGVSYQFKN